VIAQNSAKSDNPLAKTNVFQYYGICLTPA